MSSIDWMPELAAALDELVPPTDSSQADWGDVVGRARRRRRLRFGQPHRGLRLAIVVTVIFLLLAGVATATYLLVQGSGGLTFTGGGGELVVVNPNGQKLQPIARCARTDRGCSILAPAWSPDGTRVAFLAGYYIGGSGLIKSHLFVYLASANGAGARRLASCGICGQQYGEQLAWSPNGKWIAFSRDAGPTQGYLSLWLVPAAGGKPHRITDCHASCVDIQPVWSPDGHLIAFQHFGRTRKASGLYTVRPDGRHLTKIASTWGDPKWSPDGRRIAFDYGPNSIAVANANGTHLHVLLTGGSPRNGPGAPSWSPEGRELLYFTTPRTHLHGGYRYEVWTMNAEGTDKRLLYRSRGGVMFYATPIWSPNGRMIAFAANTAGGTFVINANGTGLRRVSTDIPSSLSWQPSSKRTRTEPRTAQRPVATINIPRPALSLWYPYVPAPTRSCLLRHHAHLRPSKDTPTSSEIQWVLTRNRSDQPSAWITMTFDQTPQSAAVYERSEKSLLRTTNNVGSGWIRHHITRVRNVEIENVFRPLAANQLATITGCLQR